MNLRAIIFDIYNTLLEVGPPPAQAGEAWSRLCAEFLPDAWPPTLADFQAGCREAIAREHARARGAGITFPEVVWPEILRAAWPPLAGLDPGRLEDFIVREMAVERSLAMCPAAAMVLRQAVRAKPLLGLASNAQSYTLVELAAALNGYGLGLGLFDPELCFFSFRHGFSKPDPHVFRLLEVRLRLRGISPEEVLMIGDRFENDIAPAQSFRWRTWQLRPDGNGVDAGSWSDLESRLAGWTQDRTSIPGP